MPPVQAAHQRRHSAISGARARRLAGVADPSAAPGGRPSRRSVCARGAVHRPQTQRQPAGGQDHQRAAAGMVDRANGRAGHGRPRLVPGSGRTAGESCPGRRPMSATPTALENGVIFPGLRPFVQRDALPFFGREQQIDELLRSLDETRFLAVVGLSGSGKSSLVCAGLLPALRRGHLRGAGPNWHAVVMRPGADPLVALARGLNETLGERQDRLEILRSGSSGLLDASRLGRTAEENLLVVVDQFEEIFRFQRESRDGAARSAEFVDLLLAARECEPEYRAYVVITMRSDYLGDCARFAGLPEALNESQYLVPRMTREQLREAIVGPAALGGAEVAQDLLEELLDKTGDDPDQLPILQHLLMRMWEHREPGTARARVTRKAYSEVGGWEQALNRHAESLLHALPGPRRELAKRIFQRLTAKGRAGHQTRRPTALQELAAISGGPSLQEEVKSVVEHFRQQGCSFLTSPSGDLRADSVIDISHESLIRCWSRLREWVEDEALSAEWYQRVASGKRLYDRGEGGLLVDPELEAALQIRDKGRWNEVWAERYAIGSAGTKLPYEIGRR